MVGLPRLNSGIIKLRDKTKFLKTKITKPTHEGAHARPRDACLLEMHACKMYACEVHAYEVHPHEMCACEVHPHEMRACEVHPHEMHAHEVHAHEMYAQ